MFGGPLDEFLDQPISVVATPEADHPFRHTHYLEELVEGRAETFECRVRARYGRSGVYDAAVTRDGDLIAEFRGRSRTISPGRPA